jgi:glycosyltransferase involved in cell wall biosynthesis
MKWTFWLGVVSPHISEALRALASMPGQIVTVVAEYELTEVRKSIGWNTPDCSPARVLIEPLNAEIERLIDTDCGRDTIHMIAMEKRGSLNRRVLPRLVRTEAMVGLMSETVDNRGILGLVRRAKYCLERYSIEDKVDFLLVVGQVGVQWYKSVGYDPSRIFPLIYVTERPTSAADIEDAREETEAFRVLYLGHFIRRKDGVTAIRALSGLPDLDWQFDAVGNGPDLERWKRAASESGVAGRIRFHGAVNNKMIGNLFEKTDLLLLPSRYDGWGAVVNEALMCGVPVVCSDNCGAAELLREPWRGATFTAGSAEDLKMVLREWMGRGKRTTESSARIREWSSAIEGGPLARYLVEVIEYMRDGGERPTPPWY